MIFDRFADWSNPRSLAARLRRRRFRILLDLLGDISGPVRILDVGGTPGYWSRMLDGSPMRARLRITLLNAVPMTEEPGYTFRLGDGRAMPQFADGEFDLVFSNSTLEHVGAFDDQRRMADEVGRVGRRHCVQTPNRYFPLEPHFLFPGFQFLPVPWRVWLVRHFRLGWFERMPDRTAALRAVTEIRLLTRSELQRLFPEAAIVEERFCGLVKSFMVCHPAPPSRSMRSRGL